MRALPQGAVDFERNRDMLFSEESRCTLSSESQLRSYNIMSRYDNRELKETLPELRLSGMVGSLGYTGKEGLVNYRNHGNEMRDKLGLNRSATIAEAPHCG